MKLYKYYIYIIKYYSLIKTKTGYINNYIQKKRNRLFEYKIKEFNNDEESEEESKI